MNRIQCLLGRIAYCSICAVPVAIVAICFFCAAGAIAAPNPWWDCVPRFVATTDLQTAVDYHANMALNGVGSDPGWGPWFTWTSPGNLGNMASYRQSFDAAGIHSMAYTNTFGSQTPIVSTGAGTPALITYTAYDWQLYNGVDPIVWAGCWTWFDDADFARPYTRTGPNCPGSPATYPDGTVATGFINNDMTDPRNSRVYDACASNDIFGNVTVSSWDSNPACNGANGQHAGLIYYDGIYAAALGIADDSACPMWGNYHQALTQFGTSMEGNTGTWCDSMSAWNPFLAGNGPVQQGFGKWSVALFRAYLQNTFSVSQLISMGVLTSGQTYANLSTFDITTYLKNKASSAYGWDGVSIPHNAWINSGWINDPVWSAYKIYKRQTGTEGIAGVCNGDKAGAAAGGQPDYLVQGNDIAPCMSGWNRGCVDMASTELSLSWNLSSGSRGITLPPFGRVAPFYKAAREHAQSRYVIVWLYNDGYTAQLALTPVVNALYYEMLATNTSQKLEPTNTEMVGNPDADKAFFGFIADKADPEFGLALP